LQIGVLNAPDLITGFAIAEERKTALFAQEAQAEGMHNNPKGIQMCQLPDLL
jgi:hypothetical protein